MDEIGKLVDSINRHVAGARQSQIRFAECVSVDWQGKSMVAKGSDDEVEYLDVVLGFGYVDIKPAIGSLCLIGIIDGQEVFTFLINAETVELVEMKASNVICNGGDNQGLVKVKELTERLNTLEQDLNTLKNSFMTWTPSPSDGGAALKAATMVWTGKKISVTSQSEIEDLKIKH